MTTLVLCLSGPLQAWGTRARWNDRDTEPWPTLSGVAGLLASAMGTPRTTTPQWTHNLQLAVRADRPGAPLADFHTANAPNPTGAHPARKSGGGAHTESVVTTRHYLADAAFIAAVAHPDANVIALLSAALARPRWAPYLGRRSCPPALPVRLGTTTQAPEDVLMTLGLLRPPPRSGDTVTVTAITDAGPPTSWIDDHPTSRDPWTRTFTRRGVTSSRCRFTAEQCAGPGWQGWNRLHTQLAEPPR